LIVAQAQNVGVDCIATTIDQTRFVCDALEAQSVAQYKWAMYWEQIPEAVLWVSMAGTASYLPGANVK